MGMYTGLRVDCILKDEFVNPIEDLLRFRRQGVDRPWEMVGTIYFWYPFFYDWAREDMANFIPWGGELPNLEWEKEKRNWVPELKGNNWRFQCGLRNYGKEIEKFLGSVLYPMCSSITLIETQYEEDENSVVITKEESSRIIQMIKK